MHIYIIAQHLNIFGQGQDRLYKVGREFAEREHKVTLLTGNHVSGFDLGQKKIGLKQLEGQTLIALNVQYEPEMSRWQKVFAYLRFARLAGRQGLALPGPDMIFLLSPPLTAALAALKLSKHYGVPLVVEVREIWPDALIEHGNLKNSVLIRAARKLEKRLYDRADRIIVSSNTIAGIIKERLTEKSKVTLISDQIYENEMIGMFDTVLKDQAAKKKS